MMCNRLFKYLSDKSILYEKTIWFSEISQHWVCYCITCKSTLLVAWWNQVHVRSFYWSKESVWHSGPQNSYKKCLSCMGLKGATWGGLIVTYQIGNSL